MITRREAVLRVAVLGLAAIAPRSLRAQAGKPFPHPHPRPGITGANVLPNEQLPDRRRVREAFAAARTHPETFDGVYCVCECADSMKHRSLLACFESRQPVGCWGCQEQAEAMAGWIRDGKSLAEIRAAVDEKWGD
jgi:hypothetical protein